MHPLDDQLSLLLSEKYSFLSTCRSSGLVGVTIVEPSTVGCGERLFTSGKLSLKFRDFGKATPVPRPLKSSEACVEVFGPARDDRRDWQPLGPFHRDSIST